MVAPLHGFMEDLVIAVIAEVFNMLSFCFKHSVKYWTTLKTKRNRPLPFTVTNRSWAHELSQVTYFHIAARRDTFMLSSDYNAVQRGKQMQIQSLLICKLFIS